MRKLLEQRAKIVSEMRAISEKPEGDGGDLSEAQEIRFHNFKVDLEKLEKRIERQALLDEADRREQGTPLTGSHGPELRSNPLMRGIQHMLGAKVDAGDVIEASQELARRDGRTTDGLLMSYSTLFERRADVITTGQPAAGPGSNMIGTDHLGSQFIDLLREANPLTGFGVRTPTGLVGNVDIPKLKESTSVGWLGENSDIPQTDAKFDKITLSPKHVGAWCEYSRNMLLQSSPDIESILRSDLSIILAQEVARAMINGTGTGNEPRGILNTSGIQKIAKPTDDMDYAPELASALFLKNVSGISFLANSLFKAVVDKKLTADGLPIGAAAFFRNYPHKFTTLVPAVNELIAGDFSQIIQGTWSAVEVLVNPYMEVARTVSGNSANKDRKNLAALWEWGKKYAGLPTLNPFREVEKFPFDEQPRYVPTEEDFWKAYAVAQEHDQVFLLFMLHTGARMGEVYRLKWHDVDLQARKVRLGTRKNSLGGMKYEWLPMTTKLFHALGPHKLNSKSEYVFIDPATCKPYSARGHFMKRLCRRAKLKPFGFHAIRHLTATMLAYEGLSMPELQTILRHSNPNTTARYIKRLGVQVNTLDRVFEKREAPKVLSFEAHKRAICT